MIKLNGHALSLEEVWQVASLQSSCELAAEARPLIRRSRELVESLAAQVGFAFQQLQSRAQAFLDRIEGEYDEKRKALGVADELKEIPGVTKRKFLFNLNR